MFQYFICISLIFINYEHHTSDESKFEDGDALSTAFTLDPLEPPFDTARVKKRSLGQNFDSLQLRKLSANDPRRSYIFKFTNAVNSADVDVMWEFIRNYTSVDVEFHQLVNGEPPEPLQPLKKSFCFRGQHRLCHLLYGRSQIFPDGFLHVKEAKLQLRADGTTMIRAAGMYSGAPTVGPDVIYELERIADEFALPDDSTTDISVNSIAATDDGTADSSNSNASYANDEISVCSGKKRCHEYTFVGDDAANSREKVPDAVYRRVHSVMYSLTEAAIAKAAKASVRNGTITQGPEVADANNTSDSALQLISPTPQRLRTSELRSMQMGASVTITMIIDRNLKINYMHKSYYPVPIAT